jgi:cytochrome c553
VRRTSWLLLAMVLLPAAHAALPGDSAAGKRLHDANCLACHDPGVYTRKDHRVRSLAELKEQLAACTHATKKDFSARETEDLLKYLNERFYRFQ